MALSGFLVPFATGALTKAQDIRDEQDEIAGAMIDESSINWRTKFESERERIKKKKELYTEIENGWGKPIAEIMGHLGFLDDGDTEKAYAWLKEIGPENIAKFKNLKPEDYKSVFLENADQITKSIESKENVLAKNSTREGLKNMSDLYFGDTIRKEGGKLDTARQFLFGGPILREGDIEASRLQLAKEIKAEEPTLEQPDERLLDVISTLPLGPMAMASGGEQAFPFSEFRLRQTDAIDVALSSLGLSGKYTIEEGTIKPTTFTDLDGLTYGYASELISQAFMAKDFNPNTYKQVGTMVANIIRNDLNKTHKSFQTFMNFSAADVELLPTIVKNNKSTFNYAGYELFLQANVELLAIFANSKSYTHRQLIIQRYGDGAYRKYFNQFLKELDQKPPK